MREGFELQFLYVDYLLLDGHACKYDTLLLHIHIDLALRHGCKLAIDG